ncbi:MAG: aldo/keto reductase [Leptolyngbya sp. SIO1E4]|nr:aldo/keto reductase [Leptolyngbya sp. SIO1E4]
MQFQSESQAIALIPDGPKIPALGVGTWAWGDAFFWTYGKDYTETDLQAAFTASLEAGVSLFDTAEIYGFGESERLLGRFVQPADQPVTLATKYFPLPWRLSANAVTEALTASLDRLQVDRLDLYQVHWPFDFFMGQKTLMTTLAHEVKQGRIAAVGVSNYSAQQMQVAHGYLAEQGIPLAVNQVQYSLLHRKIERNGVLEKARQLEVKILAYSPLAQGLLTGKYSPQDAQAPQGARKLDPRFSRKGRTKIASVLQTLAAIAQAHNKTSAQVALNWLIGIGNVIPIPGAKNAQQASQNAGALGWEMTPEEHQQLDQVTQSWL